MPGPRISTDADEQDIELIHRFLSQESKWARGIPIETVRRSMRNSLNFGLFIGPSQVGYARVISDQATFAYLLDVFVLPEQRGKGYGRRLVDAVLAHPGLQGAQAHRPAHQPCARPIREVRLRAAGQARHLHGASRRADVPAMTCEAREGLMRFRVRAELGAC